jgi:hypothetical protein
LPSARDDWADGIDLYDAQEYGLGSYFRESLIEDVNSLIVLAGIHRTVFGFYRLLAKRFPYAIYYAVESDRILVHAIIDCRKNPKRIRQRLSG